MLQGPNLPSKPFAMIAKRLPVRSACMRPISVNFLFLSS
jgi:hypothetical protein